VNTNPGNPIRPTHINAMDRAKGEKGGEEDEVMIDEPEAPIVICPRIPYSPSNNEREHHRLTHWPFRSWCAECVMGKSRESPHKYKRETGKREHELPTISFDYMFLDGKTPTIVLRDRRSRMIFAHTVTQKGASDPWIVGKIVEDIDALGYGRVVIKSDQEPAIKDLQKEVKQQRWDELVVLMEMIKDIRGIETQVVLTNGETVLENSPAGASQSNGFIERSIQELQGQIRAIKAATEKLIGTPIPRGHCVLAWLIEWCCTIINRYSKGADGRTPYQRVRGKESNRPICQFGERLLWRPLKTAANRRDKDEPNYQDGYWLGIIHRTDEVIIGTPEGVVKCRDIRRRPVEEQGGSGGLLNIKGWPSAPNPKKTNAQIPSAIRKEGDEEEDDEPQKEEVTADVDVQTPGAEAEETVEETLVRNMRITRKDLMKYGKTKGCKACDSSDAKGVVKRGIDHSDLCRQRLQERMQEDAQDRDRLANYQLRTDERLAERMERDLTKRKVEQEGQTARKERRATGGSSASSSTTRMGEATDDARREEAKDKRAEDDLEENGEGQKRRRVQIPSTSHFGSDTHQGQLETQMRTMVDNFETGNIVSEVFSPPRVAEMAREMGLGGGWSLDITTSDENGKPWDFSKPEMRRKAKKLVEETKPTLLIGSPMCREWSILQNLNKARRDPEVWKQKMAEARTHFEFVVDLYKNQSRQGRYWLHEHPKSARSWREKGMVELLARGDSILVEGHMPLRDVRHRRKRNRAGEETNVICNKLSGYCRPPGEEVHQWREQN
jgi:hypothetical protein